MPNLSQEKLRELAESANPGPYVHEMATEILALRKDRERIDWLERWVEDCNWKNRSWICRGEFSPPKLVCVEVGDKWPEGITQPTARAAIDAAMEHYR